MGLPQCSDCWMTTDEGERNPRVKYNEGEHLESYIEGLKGLYWKDEVKYYEKSLEASDTNMPVSLSMNMKL